MTIAFIVSVITTFFSLAFMLYLQVVHLPVLKYIGAEAFKTYYDRYKMRMTILAFPVMTLEAITSLAVFLNYSARAGLAPGSENTLILYGISLFILPLMHLVTFKYIIPQYKKLKNNFEEKTCNRLLQLNLIRTVGWGLRVVLILLTMLAH